MKIKENYLHEALKADKKDKPNWASDARRQAPAEQADAPDKFRRTEPAAKDEAKFASLLESPGKPQKTSQRDDSGEQSRDADKKEQKEAAREKDSAENLTGDGKTENYESAAGGQGGGQSGFGERGGVGQAFNLNENFAARSILHIADLERLISTVRAQIGLGGRREVRLQLKRSVLDGLQVKITTDGAAKVRIEFLAASEKSRAEVEKHAGELAGILRGRGLNLETIKTGVSYGERDGNEAEGEIGATPDADEIFAAHESLSDNTFGRLTENDGTIYNA